MTIILHYDTPKKRKQSIKAFLHSGILQASSAIDLKTLRQHIRTALQGKYPDRHKRKYGPTLRRTFTPEEFSRLLHHTRKPKARLAFLLMRYLGLRVGEVVTLRLQDIDWLNRTITVHTEKTHTIDTLPLHDVIFSSLQSWANDHYEEIMAHEGYLFYSENTYWVRSHISKDWLRNYFGAVREEAGLNHVYAMTNEPEGRKPRRQYRLSTHSGRRTFGTELWQMTKDLKIVQLSLRQSDPKSCDPYIHIGQEEVHAVIRERFRSEPLLQIYR